MPSVRMSPDECWEMVESSINGTFVTLRADGWPIALPLWFVVLDRKIYIITRGKKVQRLRRDPRCSFLVEAGEKWAELRAVHIECTGRVIEPSEELEQRIRDAVATKYGAYRARGKAMASESREHYRAAVGSTLELEPSGKMLNWDNRRMSGG